MEPQHEDYITSFRHSSTTTEDASKDTSENFSHSRLSIVVRQSVMSINVRVFVKIEKKRISCRNYEGRLKSFKPNIETILYPVKLTSICLLNANNLPSYIWTFLNFPIRNVSLSKILLFETLTLIHFLSLENFYPNFHPEIGNYTLKIYS